MSKVSWRINTLYDLVQCKSYTQDYAYCIQDEYKMSKSNIYVGSVYPDPNPLHSRTTLLSKHPGMDHTW